MIDKKVVQTITIHTGSFQDPEIYVNRYKRACYIRDQDARACKVASIVIDIEDGVYMIDITGKSHVDSGRREK